MQSSDSALRLLLLLVVRSHVHHGAVEQLDCISNLLDCFYSGLEQFQPAVQTHLRFRLYGSIPPPPQHPVGAWWSMADWLARRAAQSDGGLPI